MLGSAEVNEWAAKVVGSLWISEAVKSQSQWISKLRLDCILLSLPGLCIFLLVLLVDFISLGIPSRRHSMSRLFFGPYRVRSLRVVSA